MRKLLKTDDDDDNEDDDDDNDDVIMIINFSHYLNVIVKYQSVVNQISNWKLVTVIYFKALAKRQVELA